MWGALGRRGSRALRACLLFSTLTRYPRLFADVSSQFFSYGESHPHPHPCLLRNPSLETWGCGARPRGPRPVFLQGARLSSFAFPTPPPRFSPSLPSFSRTRSPPQPRATSPGSHTYLAATSPACFLSAFICISSPLHLLPRRAQHLMLNPDVGKTLPGVPLLRPRGPGLNLRGFAFPGINSVRLFANELQ